jgi:hypothetical protein
MVATVIDNDFEIRTTIVEAYATCDDTRRVKTIIRGHSA